jgi:very-short-patch-repair endonuclease
VERDEYISREAKDRLIEAAREMRQYPTEAEVVLWEALRRKQIDGFRFRRQHVIHTFIVDFYCPEVKLVVEVDGEIHLSQTEYDAYREDVLAQMGYTVLRFTNEQVLGGINDVLMEIRRKLHK